MNAPPPVDPHITERVASTLEFGAKVAIALGAVWAFLEKALRPYLAWRRTHRKGMIREAIKDDLALVTQAIVDGNSCADRIEQAISENTLLFADFDTLLDIVLDNSDRIDMTSAETQSQEMVDKLKQLSVHRRARRRKGD